MHISGPPGRRKVGGWASPMLRVLKVQFKTLFVFVRAEVSVVATARTSADTSPIRARPPARPSRLRVVRNVRSEEALHGE